MGEKGNGGGPADQSTAVNTGRSNIKNNDEVDTEGTGTTASDSGASAEAMRHGADEPIGGIGIGLGKKPVG